MLSTDFISATKDFSTELSHIPAPYLRKTFLLEQKAKKATITICGLGFYELFINGKKITKGLFAPYISNPDDILYYDEYDITDILQSGKNVIGIMLGNGMLNCVGGAVWQFERVRYRSAPKVAFALEMIIESGETKIITADDSIKVHPSPILFDDMRCGEIYDANREIKGWELADFDDSNWDNAIPTEAPRGTAKLCKAEPIVALKKIKPVSIKSNISAVYNTKYRLSDNPALALSADETNGYLYDFGENLAGIFKLKIKGEKGQKISIITGEVLDADGNLDMRGMSFQPPKLDHRVEYTLKGDGMEEYTPTFTSFGFRYCLVVGITKNQATKELLEFIVMGSDLKKNGDFNCSDDIANRLQKATYNSDISNFYYYPMDCPHREKNGWTADAALSAEQMLFNLNPENSYHIWLDNIRKAQREDGALPGIVPTGGWGFDWGNGPAWDAVIFYLPYYTWLQRGDIEIIKENATAMMRYLEYISTKRDEQGLLHIGLTDWAVIRYKLPVTPKEVTDTLVTMNLCTMAAKMFNAIGMNIQRKFALGLFDELKASARKHLILSDGVTVLGRTQTAQAMGIEYGLFNENERQAAFKVLLDIIYESDEHMDLGCLGARIIFHILARFGYAELAYKMITRPEYPSYGYWILSENATTLFERFQVPGALPDSKNHHFFGDISSWFFKYIVGVKINPHEKDIYELEISPNFITGLEYASGYQYHVGGKIESIWRRESDSVHLCLTVPDGCYGYIIPPKGYLITSGNARDNIMHIEAGEKEYIFIKK